LPCKKAGSFGEARLEKYGNAVQVARNAYPGQSYVLQTTTNLAGPWSSSSPLIATSNLLAFNFP